MIAILPSSYKICFEKDSVKRGKSRNGIGLITLSKNSKMNWSKIVEIYVQRIINKVLVPFTSV